MINLDDYERVHFIGAGGVSMCVLAEYLSDIGKKVSGSDAVFGKNMEKLKSRGIDAYCGCDTDKLKDCKIVVANAAIKDDNPELVYALKNNLKVIKRKELLALIAKSCKTVIAISGTHGKTTATAMLGKIFKVSDKRFLLHIGGNAQDFSGGYYFSGYDYFITEACEYKRSFLSIGSDISVVLNVEQDHPDCYKNYEDIHNAFDEFTKKAKKCAVINANFAELNTFADKITFGSNGDFRAVNIYDRNEKYEFDVLKNGDFFVKIRLGVSGRHNVDNALACVAVADYSGIDKLCIKKGLESFKGTERRFETVGKLNDAPVITDYAHHPSEIQAVVDTASKLTKGKLFVVFEPHTYSRTKRLFEEFTKSFDMAYEVCFLPTYPARETPDMGTDSFTLYSETRKRIRAKYFSNYFECEEYLKKTITKKDYLLVLGAGNIDKLAENICKK